jgi:hypothetical protein
MNSTPRYPATPKLRAAGLWQKTSAAGNTYFAGRLLGGVKLLILENRDRAGEGEPSHFLFFTDGETLRPETRGTALSPRQRRPAARRDHDMDGELDDRVDDPCTHDRPLKMEGLDALGDFAVQLRMKMMTLRGENFMTTGPCHDQKNVRCQWHQIRLPTVQIASDG